MQLEAILGSVFVITIGYYFIKTVILFLSGKTPK